MCRKAVIIGAGNVASHIGPAINDAGFCVAQIYSRSLAHANALAEKIGAVATNRIDDIYADADIYVVSLSDDAILPFVKQMAPNDALWVHTSGSVGMEVLSELTSRYGVFYPMQTFSKGVTLDMSAVPLFIEGCNADVEGEIRSIGEQIFAHVYHADSELRRRMHIAAVFSCNFTNYMWVLASELLQKEGLSFDVMRPLLEETMRKAFANSPAAGQTGPAVRGDKNILATHLGLLDGIHKDVYASLSEKIYTHFHPEK